MPITTSWVRFDELMERASGRETTVIDDATYKCVGVRWYGKGAFVRETPIGMDIGRKQQWIIRKGDVVYNKLFAWKGAFAVADDEVDGCIVSDKFPLYRIREDRLIPAYLKYYFATAELAKQAELLSKGAAAISKLTLNPPQFWDLKLSFRRCQNRDGLWNTLRASPRSHTRSLNSVWNLKLNLTASAAHSYSPTAVIQPSGFPNSFPCENSTQLLSDRRGIRSLVFTALGVGFSRAKRKTGLRLLMTD